MISNQDLVGNDLGSFLMDLEREKKNIKKKYY